MPASLPVPASLHQLGEHFAAGYFELPDASPVLRWSRAVRRRFEYRFLAPYRGERLYPCGDRSDRGGEDRILSPCYSHTWRFDETALTNRLAESLENGDSGAGEALAGLGEEIRGLAARLDLITTPHTVGGRGYTHSIPHYGRVIREGLDAYGERVSTGLAAAESLGDVARAEFYRGLQDVLTGIRVWHRRIVAHLEQVRARGDDAVLARLISSLSRVPFAPAESFYDAVVCYNFIYYVDDCDNPGRIDQELIEPYLRDLEAGITSRAEATGLIRQLWENCDVNNGWSAGVGGSDPKGDASYNELTLACIEAARGMRRPNLQLHLRKDTPDEVWDEALATISSGCGLPALYNEEEYIRGLREAELGIRETDLGFYNGGGCTETMIHGCSNVGSLDAGINLPKILVDVLRTALPGAETFESVLSAFRTELSSVIDEICRQVSAHQEAKARLRPQPVRSLLIDDCIDRGLEYHAGGARYNWSVVNVAGIANLADSLAAVREAVFEGGETTASELLEVLDSNFDGHEDLRRFLQACPRYGNDDPRVDGIAAEMSELIFREFLSHSPWRGGKFLPSCLMFVTYAREGLNLGATPDGRKAGDPIADSAGPHQGRDRNGPTAMLRSVTAIPHRLAMGTLVVNVRFDGRLFQSLEGRRKIRNLVEGYFALGGMQLQINVVDQETLRDALDHPEQYEDLVVRIGGYSEYWGRLSPELRQTVLERTAHHI